MMDIHKNVIDKYLVESPATCSFCDRIEPLVLYTGDYFYITLAIGQISEGYMQICSKEHKTSIASFDYQEIDEIYYFRKVIKNIFKQLYDTPGILFENGRLSKNYWEQDSKNDINLDYHTHIHFVPVSIDIRNVIKENLDEEILVANYSDIKNIKNEKLNGGRYLLHENTDGICFLYPIYNRSIPSRFLRNCVAKAIGKPEKGNWRMYPGYEHFKDAKEKIFPLLTKYLKLEGM